MTGQTVILSTRAARERAHALIDAAPERAVLNIAAERRTNDQNALMWARLSDISRAKPGGRTLTPDVWKALFLHSLDFAQRFEMALDGKGMVPVGFRSSRLTKEQMGDLLTMIEEYAARHGIDLSDTDGSPKGTDPKGLDGEAATAGAEGIAQRTSP
jgi:hypothetical protein